MIYYNNPINNTTKEFNNDTEFSIFLITQELLARNKQPKQIKLAIKENLSNLDHLAKALGKNSIKFFIEYFLRDFAVPSDTNEARNLAPVHYEIFEELDKLIIQDQYDKEEFILPRGCSKSTVINKFLSTWSHCYKKSIYTIVIGNKSSDAEQFIADTKKMLSCERIIKTFGDLTNSQKENNFTKRKSNAQEIELTNDTKIQAFSWGSSVRGTTYKSTRPTLILMDDVQSEDDVLTDNAKEKCRNKLYKEIMEVGDKPVFRNNKKIKQGSKFLFVGTPLTSDCLVSSLRDNPDFVVFHRSVTNINPDEYFENPLWQEYKQILFNHKDQNRKQNAEKFYHEHEEEMKFPTIWEKYNCWELANTYFTNRLGFMQELMCDCEKVGNIWITNMAKLSAEEIESHKFERTVLAIDQGASNTRKSDYTAMTVLGKSNGFYLVRSGQLYKFDSETEFDKYIDTVIQALLSCKDIDYVFLEKNVYKGVDATRIQEKIQEIPELKRRKIQVITRYSNTNKDSRIATITEKINTGQIIFNKSNEEYNKQVFEFRGQKFTLHDDAVDSLEMAVNEIDNLAPKRYGVTTSNSLFG